MKILLVLSCGCQPVGVDETLPYAVGAYFVCPVCNTEQSIVERRAPGKRQAEKWTPAEVLEREG